MYVGAGDQLQHSGLLIRRGPVPPRPDEQARRLGKTGPLSQGAQARRKALRTHHINGMEVRKKRPRGFKKEAQGVQVSPLNPLSVAPWPGPARGGRRTPPRRPRRWSRRSRSSCWQWPSSCTARPSASDNTQIRSTRSLVPGGRRGPRGPRRPVAGPGRLREVWST